MVYLSRLEQQQKNINIAGIAIPEHQSSNPRFNPEQDISENTWEQMKNMLDYLLVHDRFVSFILNAAYMRVLRRKEMDEYLVEKGTKPRNYLFDSFADWGRAETLDQVVDLTLGWMLFPREMRTILNNNSKLENSIEVMFNKAVSEPVPTTEDDHELFFCCRLLLEAFAPSLLPLDEEELLISREEGYVAAGKGYLSIWLPYIETCAWRKVLFPATFSPIPSSHWRPIKEALQAHDIVGKPMKDVFGDLSTYAKHAALAAIASADGIILSDDGIMPVFSSKSRIEEETQEATPPPARRSF